MTNQPVTARQHATVWLAAGQDLAKQRDALKAPDGNIGEGVMPAYTSLLSLCCLAAGMADAYSKLDNES